MKSSPALLGVVLLALGLGACGEGGKPTTATTSSSRPGAGAASSSAPARPAPTNAAPTTKPSSAGNSVRQGGNQATQSSGSSTERRYPHGDNSIQTFGHRGGESEQQIVSAVVKRYYAAVAAGDGSAACSLLSSGLAKSITQSFGRAPALRGKAKGCGDILSLLFVHRGGRPAIDTSVQVTQLRVNGSRAFALLRSKMMPQGEIPMYREGGAWKIGALIGSALQ